MTYKLTKVPPYIQMMKVQKGINSIKYRYKIYKTHILKYIYICFIRFVTVQVCFGQTSGITLEFRKFV